MNVGWFRPVSKVAFCKECFGMVAVGARDRGISVTRGVNCDLKSYSTGLIFRVVVVCRAGFCASVFNLRNTVTNAIVLITHVASTFISPAIKLLDSHAGAHFKGCHP